MAYGQDLIHCKLNKYTIKEGLTGNNIRNLLQDSLGCLWIPTQDGLNRFDGKKMLQYTSGAATRTRIPTVDIRAVVMDPSQQSIWALSNLDWLTSINVKSGKVERKFRIPQRNFDDWNSTMTSTHDQLWVGGGNGVKIFNLKNQTWKSFPSPFTRNKTNDLLVVNFVQTLGGLTWVSYDNYGLVLYDHLQQRVARTFKWSELFPSSSQTSIILTGILEKERNHYLIGTSEGLCQISKSKNLYQVEKIDNSLLSKSKITALAKSRGFMYAATPNGLYRFDDRLRQEIKYSETYRDDWLTQIQSMCTDQQENIWLGCKQGIAYLKTKNSPFQSINNHGLPIPKFNNVYYLKPLGGTMIVGMEQGLGLYDLFKRSYSLIISNRSFGYAFHDANDHLIVAAENGLSILNKVGTAPLAQRYREWLPFADYSVNSHIQKGDSLVVLGSENEHGVLFWRPHDQSIHVIDDNSSPLRLRSNIVNKIHEDRKGNTWVLSDLNIDILNRSLTNVNYLHLAKPSLKTSPNLFFDMCETNNHVWITSYGHGLLQLDKSGKLLNVYDTQHGLSTNGVYKVFNHQDKFLVVSTNNGLAVFDLITKRFHNFYEEDGLHGNAFEENCGIEHEGKFILGGLNGFTIVDPKLITINTTPPKVYVDRIQLETSQTTNDTTNLLMSQLDVPSDVLRATLHLSAINFSNPAKTKTEYRVMEIHPHWISTEGQDMIQLMGLSPGTYTVQVRAINEHGFASAPRTLALRFLPKWYQTIWFTMAMVLLAVLLVYLLYRYRMNQLKKQHLIRKNIASDLHDDIGSSLNTVKIFAHLAKSDSGNPQYLNEIESTLTQASTGMRDMIWVLDDSNDTWRGLIERIEKMLLPVMTSQGVALKVELADPCGEEVLNKAEKKNILLIAKEAINNSIKYAQCTTITLRLAEERGVAHFSICDNGHGFDPAAVQDGNGLKNMQYRAEQIGFSLAIHSSAGCQITLVQKRKKGKWRKIWKTLMAFLGF